VLRRPVESAQYTSIRYTERLDEAGATPSIGSVGDSYDNALAESIIGLFKTRLPVRILTYAWAAAGTIWRWCADLLRAVGPSAH